MSIVLEPPAVDPGVTDDERRTIVEMMAKGSYVRINLATADLDGAFARLRASGADVVQADRAAVRGSRLRLPRSRGQPDPLQQPVLSHPAIAAITCTDGTVRR